MIRFWKTVFGKPFLEKLIWPKNILVAFDNFFTEENVAKKIEEKCQILQANKKLGQKLSQKLQQIPTTNRYKIQNNNARAASGARPIFGVLVLNFVSFF